MFVFPATLCTIAGHISTDTDIIMGTHRNRKTALPKMVTCLRWTTLLLTLACITAILYIYHTMAYNSEHTIENFDASRIPFHQVCKLWSRSLSTSHRNITFSKAKGYMLVLFIAQQTQSALIEFYALARIAASLRLQIVEPLLAGSHFGVPSHLHKGDRNVILLRFSDLYDLNAANKQLEECLGIDYPLIASFEEFVSAVNSSAEVVFLNLMKKQIDKWCYSEHQKKGHIKSIEEMVNNVIVRVQLSTPNVRNEPDTNQTTTFHFIGDRPPRSQYAKPSSGHRLSISKVLCVDATGKINLTEVFQSAVNTGNNPTSMPILVIPEWMGIKPEPQFFYYYDPDYVRKDCKLLRSLQPSETLVSAAQQFWNFMHLSRPRLGIHMRMENLLTNSYNTEDVRGCTNRAITALETLRDSYGLDLHNAVFIRDYSPMGTVTCGWQCTIVAIRTAFDSRLKQLGVHIVEYNNMFSCTTGDRVLMSYLERELISQADYLLTLADGSYHINLVARFLANHPNPEDIMFMVCPGPAGTNRDKLPHQ